MKHRIKQSEKLLELLKRGSMSVKELLEKSEKLRNKVEPNWSGYLDVSESAYEFIYHSCETSKTKDEIIKVLFEAMKEVLGKRFYTPNLLEPNKNTRIEMALWRRKQDENSIEEALEKADSLAKEALK